MTIKALRGMNDHLVETRARYDHIQDVAFLVAGLYGYRCVHTPLLESTEVFSRPLGEVSDIVGKEMYTFHDRSDLSVTLRPELTAGMVRAVLQHQAKLQTPLRWIQSGSAFRYERPQQGRFRQFSQVSLEHIGCSSVSADIECILVAWRILKHLGIDQHLQLKINSLGAPKSRQHYRETLKTYLLRYMDDLSPESQRRLEKNPLRILDSKSPQDQAICQDAPQLSDAWSKEDKQFFHHLTHGLDGAAIPWEHCPHLVRGLDYYSHTVFEFTTTELGAQDAVLSGGRYDGLATLLAAKTTNLPGVGWGMGVDRVSLLIQAPPQTIATLAIIPLGAEQSLEAQKIGEVLRDHKISCLTLEALHPQGHVSRKQMGRAFEKIERNGVTWGLIVGEQEMQSQIYTLRNLAKQENLSCSSLADVMRHLAQHTQTTPFVIS